MTQDQDTQTTDITINDRQFTLHPIKFADIKAGDVIAHEVENQNIQIGQVRHLSKKWNEWYGNGRLNGMYLDGNRWARLGHNPHENVLLAAQWHETESGHRLWLVVERKSIEMDGLTFELQKTDFESIREGDTIMHLVESKGQMMDLWMGMVERKSEVSDEWYGNGRRSSHGSVGMRWAPSERDDRADVLIAADWHATEPGHSLWVVLEN